MRTRPTVCLGMLARRDASAEPLLETVLGIVGPSFDGTEMLWDEGLPVADFAAARNQLIDRAEDLGYDWMFMLDSDECMFPADIQHVRSLMTAERRLIVLPRYEFVHDFGHYDPSEYPDYQRRVFRLGVGYRFRRKVHEGLYRRFSPFSETRLRSGFVSDTTPIYHYGRLKSAAAMELKLLNYDRLADGLPPLSQLSPGHVVTEQRRFWRECEPFTGPHPLESFAGSTPR